MRECDKQLGVFVWPSGVSSILRGFYQGTFRLWKSYRQTWPPWLEHYNILEHVIGKCLKEGKRQEKDVSKDA